MMMGGFFSGGTGVKGFVLCVLFLFFLNGCGSSGNSDSLECPEDPGCPDSKLVTIEPSLSTFIGTYDLQGFRIRNETGSVDIDESDVESWCGRLVVGSEGVILYEQSLNGNLGNYIWQIVDITKNAFKIREGECEAWVDYLLAGDDFMLIWPEGPCMENYSLTLKTIKISDSEMDPTDSCPVPEDTPEDTIDPEIEAFAGTYELLEFTYTDTRDGSVMTQDDAVSWSGQMVATADGVIDFNLIMNGQEYESVWEIHAVDSEAQRILLVDGDACEEWIDFQRDGEDNTLTLVWSGDGCTNGIAMSFRFSWTGDSNATLNGLVSSTFSRTHKGPDATRLIWQVSN